MNTKPREETMSAKEEAVYEAIVNIRGFTTIKGLVEYGFDAGVKAERRRIQKILDQYSHIDHDYIYEQLFPDEQERGDS